MVSPLVDHPQGPLEIAQSSHTVLCQDSQAECIDHLRNAVVNLRIHMVGTS